MQKLQEMVLYYQAGRSGEKEEEGAKKGKADKDKEKAVRLMKSVLVRMGVRIKNIGADQVLEKVGYLAGLEGYLPCVQDEKPDELPVILQDVLVMKNFTSSRIDVLLAGLRKAGVPKIELKAIITPQNADWSFFQLYQELVREHDELEEKK